MLSVARESVDSAVARERIAAFDAELSGFYQEDGAAFFDLGANEVEHRNGTFLVARSAGALGV